MEVQVVSSTNIQAAGAPTGHAFALPLTVFDKFAPGIHVSAVYAFTAPTGTNAAIKDGLAKTLAHFPTLTGRLGVDDLGRPCVHVGGGAGGVLLVEATVESNLADNLPLEPSPELLKLHPPTEEAEHVLQLQLNRFRCGGLVVGVATHHRVADGQSMSNFFVAWGKSVRGIEIDPLPFYDSCQWLQPRRPPRCEFEHWGVEFVPRGKQLIDNKCSSSDPVTASERGAVCNLSLHYSPEYIAKTLKAQMREKYTTFQVLLAHLWRMITVARGLDGDEFTHVSVSVNGRSRLKPPVAPEFFGNLVLEAHPRARVRELLEGGLEGAAKLIRDAVRRTDNDYFRSFIDFGAMHEGEELKPPEYASAVASPNLEADSWLGFRFHDLDFGGGGSLCVFAPSWIPVEGVVILLPSSRGGGGGGRDDGGVDVVVTMLEEHASLLREISH